MTLSTFPLASTVFDKEYDATSSGEKEVMACLYLILYLFSEHFISPMKICWAPVYTGHIYSPQGYGSEHKASTPVREDDSNQLNNYCQGCSVL